MASLWGTITNNKGMKKTPIFMVFVGNTLVFSYFGLVSAGNDPNAPHVVRASTKDLKTFRTTILTNAPSPNGYSQLSAIVNGSPKNEGLGTVVLTYVQAGSNLLVSWEDDLNKYEV
ncbi:uncharacterized protein B0I36DRAFT_385878 [Microdochium trichocladiopsis]|uniref:Uncharacterized protein n=1 Tax=Microdochium trichocladiopsis TaxID=1682393 RepID=A0A9P8Y4U0_9PEZI|nr:uncharacterized protein B0I36DRAFT_385878 [Microdochium trichocladiopsis]KAH7027957.1 hypothetical protein B0I36DRAFT_385878 [Microdochium trichocladiopsis]